MNEETKGRLESYLSSRDLSRHTRRAVRSDLAKFVKWFEAANQEPFDVKRVTVQDLADLSPTTVDGAIENLFMADWWSRSSGDRASAS